MFMSINEKASIMFFKTNSTIFVAFTVLLLGVPLWCWVPFWIASKRLLMLRPTQKVSEIFTLFNSFNEICQQLFTAVKNRTTTLCSL